MKKITIGVITIMILCWAFTTMADESSSQACDPTIEAVMSWIEPPAGFPKNEWVPGGISISFVEKRIIRAGDRVGNGIARAYSIKELLNSNRLDHVLALIRLSFKEPEYITHLEDRNPRVTLLLLFALKHYCKDMELKEKIIDTEKYINSQVPESFGDGPPKVTE